VICMQPLKESLKEQCFFDIMSLPGRVEDAALESAGTDFEMILLRKICADSVSELKEQHEAFGLSGQSGVQKAARREYKDRLFKFIFGNPDNKQWTLSLYNAMNGTDYTDPEGIRFNTIGDAVYMGMKNDVSFIICFEMNLWEHQSKFNPNMPMRFFLYAGRLYEKYITTSNYYQYSSSLQPVPRPVCVCFYNGTEEQPEKQVLKLSDAYQGEGDIEVRVTMLNINYGKNQQLMDACRPLKEYAWLVDTVRRYQQKKMDLDAAVDAAISEMPDEFVIKPFLVANRSEVKAMFLTEYDEKKVLEMEREEGRLEGREEGRKEERKERNNEVAADLIKEGGMSASFIARISKLSESDVRNLADSLGISVP